MTKGIFVTGTGTDVGKTYVTALIVKKLADAGIHAEHPGMAVYGKRGYAGLHGPAGHLQGQAGSEAVL